MGIQFFLCALRFVYLAGDVNIAKIQPSSDEAPVSLFFCSIQYSNNFLYVQPFREITDQKLIS